MKHFLVVISAVLAVALAAFLYFRYWFVFGEGVRNGELNYVVHKGLLWKTYEGKLIQSGLRSQKGDGLQSNTFDFSIEDKDLAEKMMRESGKTLEVHYKEYFAPLPWRGHSKYVVDSILSIREKESPAPETDICQANTSLP